MSFHILYWYAFHKINSSESAHSFIFLRDQEHTQGNADRELRHCGAERGRTQTSRQGTLYLCINVTPSLLPLDPPGLPTDSPQLCLHPPGLTKLPRSDDIPHRRLHPPALSTPSSPLYPPPTPRRPPVLERASACLRSPMGRGGVCVCVWVVLFPGELLIHKPAAGQVEGKGKQKQGKGTL